MDWNEKRKRRAAHAAAYGNAVESPAVMRRERLLRKGGPGFSIRPAPAGIDGLTRSGKTVREKQVMPSLHAIAKFAAASVGLLLLGGCAMWGKTAGNCTCPPTAAVASVQTPAATGVGSSASTTQVASAAPMTPQPKPAPAPSSARTAAAAPAPAAASAPEMSGAPGRIYFYRASILGTVLQPDILINGKTVGKAVPKEYSYVDRPPGTYELTTTMKNTRSLTFTLPPGSSAYVEVNVIPGIIGGKAIPLLVDESEGKEALTHRQLSVH